MPLTSDLPACLCPITQALLEDPVRTLDGQVYERSAIEECAPDAVVEEAVQAEASCTDHKSGPHKRKCTAESMSAVPSRNPYGYCAGSHGTLTKGTTAPRGIEHS